MTLLLLSPDAFAARRAVAHDALRPLADSLAADLTPLLGRDPFIPTEKALLSRAGGRCEADGADLEFDPFSPRRHRCPRCGRTYGGEWHDRWWLYPYQLWLAERAVHAALLHALGGDARYAAVARGVLQGYAERYLSYPNRDNVLGPSRIFFSTYLESLWLLHITIAADLLEGAGDGHTAESVRERIVEPAAALIAGYPEGGSNRQAWNNAALIAAGAFLGSPLDSSQVGGALDGTEALLTSAVGADGTWYEGDNYHQFAHRGLWYAVMLGERLGYDFQDVTRARFQAGFAVPFRTALPDFTYPARKDSRYAVSLRQWRFAESCELGLARADDPVLRWALARIYADDLAPGDTGRARSSGEAERPVAPVRLTRADLGWRALLFAAPRLSAEPGAPPESLTTSSGFTIHRREHGNVYVALDWGESGGGHGHPDRLNVLFSRGTARWLDDLGTGSYVDPSLHWYRSTLAHNAPLVNGASQLPADGELVAQGAGSGFDVIGARVEGIAPGVRVDRTLVTADAYFIDEVTWTADEAVRFELPFHFGAMPAAMTFTPARFDGEFGLEDGFGFVRNATSASSAAGSVVHLDETRDGTAAARVWCNRAATWFSASGPGQPATEMRPFHVIRCQGREGTIRTVWSWRDGVVATFRDTGVTVAHGGETHVHESTEDAWTITSPGAVNARFARRAPPPAADERPRPLTLDADRHTDGTASAATIAALAAPWSLQGVPLRVRPHDDRWFSDLDRRSRDGWAVFELGEAEYRRTEASWREAGEPRARVAVGAEPAELVVDVFVETVEPVFVPVGTANPLDNEEADINGHGIQVYLASVDTVGAWVIVPDPKRSRPGVRRVPGWGTEPMPVAEWRRTPGGFEVRVRIVPRSGAVPPEFALDVIVNDAGPGRARRRGQLVMTGAAGEFAYLRGDRHEASRLLRFRV
jgi:hypothetical protein